ncbi:sulfotransferase [Sphingomonas oligophenolica]|uniref:Sulfotransferase n=1 Tax=Sphingomonas oligophenolica TaxID=301154 RepID=A0ABU9YA14_9SPHN
MNMLSSAEIIARATSHRDLADTSGTWREGLDRLVAAFNSEAALNTVGEQHIASMLAGKLASRIEIEDWHARHPEIADQQIDRPVFGLGLPRTGSTALGVIMGQDPARRVLRTWEARHPCPPPETATETTDPRIKSAQAELDALIATDPSLGAMIPMSADAATECLILTSMDFRSKEFAAFGRIDSYHDWFLDCDMEPTYRFHKRVLQLLQWRCPPNRWFLRTPAHTPFLPALDAVYPDARFVMTHRDVSKVIPSNMTFVLALTAAFTDQRDLKAMARNMVHFWEQALQRLVAFREAGNDHRFFDIAFTDFQNDPLREIRRLYEWLGEPLTDIAEEHMRAWWLAQEAERRSAAKIDFAELGIPLEQLRASFAFYNDRYVR